MGRLDNKVAVITGAASGIGRQTARRFVEEGAAVILADIQADKARAVEEELGRQARFIETDVTEEAQVKAAVDLALSHFGRLDIMFNNAGSPGVSDSILEVDGEAVDKTLAILLTSVIYGIKHAGRVMVEQKSGSIINTASVAGLRGGFGPHVYAACKAAVINLTRSVGQELGEHSVRVNAICPGGIATAIFGAGMEVPRQLGDQSAEVMKNFLSQMQPVPRSGLPEDIANAALFLASDEASFVNGHALVVDGGLTTGGKWSESRERSANMRETIHRALKLDGDSGS